MNRRVEGSNTCLLRRDQKCCIAPAPHTLSNNIIRHPAIHVSKQRQTLALVKWQTSGHVVLVDPFTHHLATIPEGITPSTPSPRRHHRARRSSSKETPTCNRIVDCTPDKHTHAYHARIPNRLHLSLNTTIQNTKQHRDAASIDLQ